MALGLFSKVAGGGLAGDTTTATSGARAASTMGDSKVSGDRIITFGDYTTGGAASPKQTWIIAGSIVAVVLILALLRRKKGKR